MQNGLLVRVKIFQWFCQHPVRPIAPVVPCSLEAHPRHKDAAGSGAVVENLQFTQREGLVSYRNLDYYDTTFGRGGKKYRDFIVKQNMFSYKVVVDNCRSLEQIFCISEYLIFSSFVS